MNLNSITTPILFYFLTMVFTSYEGDKKINNPKYLNPLLSIDKRVDDLMQRMTLEDKVSQMNQFVGLEHMRSGNPNDDKANNAIKRYYRILADFLGIEPMDIKVPTQPPEMEPVPNIKNEQVNSDTEDEEEPDLIEIN